VCEALCVRLLCAATVRGCVRLCEVVAVWLCAASLRPASQTRSAQVMRSRRAQLALRLETRMPGLLEHMIHLDTAQHSQRQHDTAGWWKQRVLGRLDLAGQHLFIVLHSRDIEVIILVCLFPGVWNEKTATEAGDRPASG
jgi:hypothetical protein